MTLTGHAVVGAAIIKILPSHPILAVVLAFFSHFVLDAIPHWDYPINSKRDDPKDLMNSTMHLDRLFLKDLVKICIDGTVGVIVSLLLFAPSYSLSFSNLISLWPIVLGAGAGMIADFLQFLYLQIRVEPLIVIQRLHVCIHTEKKMKRFKFLSIASQIAGILLIKYYIG